MRVFGDLNGREDDEPNNPPGSGAVGSDGDSERARKRIEEQLQEPTGGATLPPIYQSVVQMASCGSPYLSSRSR